MEVNYGQTFPTGWVWAQVSRSIYCGVGFKVHENPERQLVYIDPAPLTQDMHHETAVVDREPRDDVASL